MSAITLFKNAGLPALKALAEGLRTNAKTSNGDSTLLKMDKTGHWNYGVDQTEIESGALWVVNPFSFIHGFVAWGDGELLGERMVAITQPLPPLEEAPAGARKGWEQQIGFTLVCTTGVDEGLEVRFATASVGGRRAAQNLGSEIATHIMTDPTTPVATVCLKSEHYIHDRYGKIFTPIFEIVKWVSMENTDPMLKLEESGVEAEAEVEAEEALAAQAEAPAAGRRRRAV